MTEPTSPLAPVEYARVMRQIIGLLAKLDEAGRREIASLILVPERAKERDRQRDPLLRQHVPQMLGGNRSRQVKEFRAQWCYYLKTRYAQEKDLSILTLSDLDCRAEEPYGRVPFRVLHQISRLNGGKPLSERRITDILDGKDK